VLSKGYGMHKLRTIAGWTGTFVASISLTFVPSYMGTHSYLALRVIIGCATGAAMCFLVWLVTPDKKLEPPSQSDARGNFVGRDNNGPQMTAGRDLIIQGGPSNSPPVVAPEQKIANLVTLPPTGMENQGSYLGQSNPSGYVSVLPIENRIPTVLASCACASLRFTGKDAIYAFVSRAFWYGELGHELEIPISEMAWIVLGSYENGRWFYYANPQQFPPAWHHDNSIYDLDESKPKYLPFTSGPITVEVSVFNRYRGYEYLNQSYLISQSEDGTSAMVERLP
jgi:hypothetical protein